MSLNKETFIHKKLSNNNKNNISIETNSIKINNENSINESHRQLLRNSNDLKNNDFSIEQNFIEKIGCSAFYLGTEPIKQEAYLCPIHSKENEFICKFCYENCHLNCFKKNELKEKIYFEFCCFCGLIQKHFFSKKQNEIECLISCNFLQLDYYLNFEFNFFCENHNFFICGICAIFCHKKCKINKIKEKNNQIINCECNNEFHTEFNEIGFKFDVKKYSNLVEKKLDSIQILNILFANNVSFNKFENLCKNLMKDFDNYEINNKNKFCDLIIKFTDFFKKNNIKIFYFHEKFNEIFKMENLIHVFNNLNFDSKKNVKLKIRLILIFLFFHLKKDFQIIKNLKSKDFYNFIIERISIKKILTKNKIFNLILDKKYNLKNLFENENILKKFLFEIINILNEKNVFKYLNFIKNSFEFEIILKFIKFMIKKLFLSKEDIKKIVLNLYNFYNIFYEFFIKNQENQILIKLNNLILKILFLISINFNDIIFNEYLEKNKNSNFINFNNNSGKLILKIVIKSSQFNLNNNLILNILSLFSFNNNIYYNQIININEEDINDYYTFCNKLNNNNFSLKKIEIEEIFKLLFDLKLSIENRLNDLFLFGYNQETLLINNKIFESMKIFSNKIQNKFNIQIK